MFITASGKRQLETDLRDLQTELDRTVSERSLAAAEGDLKENSAYIFLTERATVLSTQISQFKDHLKQVKIKSAPTQIKKIEFGHTIHVKFITDKREMTITLVGEHDAQTKPDWISVNSPLGIALLGQSLGHQIEVNGQPVSILNISIGEI